MRLFRVNRLGNSSLQQRGAAGEQATAVSGSKHKLVAVPVTVKPSKQGDLDGLCGLYCLVNAVAYLYGGRVKRQSLRHALLSAYADKWDVVELIAAGMEGERLDYLINTVLKQGFYHTRYPLRITKPYTSKRKMRIGSVIGRMQRFLAKAKYSQSRLVLIGTTDHWTLVHRVDNRYLYLFDSGGRRRAFRRSFSLRSGRVCHVLCRHSIYYLQRSREEQP